MKKPRYADYRGYPVDGFHHGMKDWAFAQSKPDLISEIIFEDGSVCTDRHSPAQREEKYWCGHENNGYYGVQVDVGNRWMFGTEPLGLAEIRKLETELANKAGAVKSIRVYKDVGEVEPERKGKGKGKVYYHEVSIGEG